MEQVIVKKDAIFEFDYPFDKSTIKTIKENIKKLSYSKLEFNQIEYSTPEIPPEDWEKNNISIHFSDKALAGFLLNKNLNFKKLYDWFQKCVEEVAQELVINEKFYITSSWANRVKQGDVIHNIKHPYSVINGIFFLSRSELEGASDFQIFFQGPMTKWSQMFLNHMSLDTYTITELQSKLILFPSSLPYQINTFPNYYTENQDEWCYIIKFQSLPIFMKPKRL